MRDTAVRPRGPDGAAAAGIVLLAAVLTIAAVWIMQQRGYAPCELCLRERIPYYVAMPLAAALVLARFGLPPVAMRLGYGVLAGLFAVGVILGIHHAGVEWKLWAGPSECSGAMAAPPDVADFLKQLRTTTVVRCDQAALVVLGLSLAGWNALVSAALVAISLWGMGRVGSR